MQHNKTLLYIGIYGLIAYGGYQLFFSKTAYAKKIIKAKKSTGSVDALKNFDMGYLRVWSKAASNNDAAFSFKGVNYNTNGGKVIK